MNPGRLTIAPTSKTFTLHPHDSVAIAAGDMIAGQAVPGDIGLVRLGKTIPSGHKYARRDIAGGEVIIKYGQPIGRATVSIAAGDHVHVHNVESLRGRGDLSLQPVAATPVKSWMQVLATLSPVDNPPVSILAYRRPSGRVGIRNHVLVLATVQCANAVVERIGREAPQVVALMHEHGCAQIGDDLAQTRRVLEGFAGHPNVGAVLLVGLGCETMPGAEIERALVADGVRCRRLSIQEEGGSRATLSRGLAIVRELLEETALTQREPVSLAELIVGVECGGSDGWSGVTANPAVGAASDMIVQAGGTVILSEVTEFIGAEHLLAARSATPEIARRIADATLGREAAARRLGVDMRGAQPSPGNIAGGLTTIEEKSLGAIAKGGSMPIREFVSYAHRPSTRGLVVMDTPGSDPESVTAMVAGGAQIVVFTTGRGAPTGCPIAPVIKVCSNSPTYRRLGDDMDVDAGTIVEKGETPAEVGSRIFQEIIAVAEGKQTAAEAWGHREFAIETIGPRL
jgi:altronate dehydratase large subunit